MLHKCGHTNAGSTIKVNKRSEIMCPQLETTVIGQEDCLVLNIYVPETVYNDPSTKAPVMVFVHGGGLVSYYV